MAANTANIKFTAPFDDDDGDLVICSSDKCYFRVYKLFMQKASPVFETMFLMPSANTPDQIHAVNVTEDGETMHLLLQLCYPGNDPQIETLDVITSLLNTCEKYQMDGIARRFVGAKLGNFISVDPLRVYVLARRAHSDEHAKQAALLCLSLPMGDIIRADVPELRHISAPAYRALLTYYDHCRTVAANVLAIRAFPWLTTEFCWFQSAHTCLMCPLSDKIVRYTLGAHQTAVRAWWDDAVAPAIPYLRHQAAPLAPNLLEFVRFPGDLPCAYCKSRAEIDLYRFLGLLTAEIERQVKAVSVTL